MLAEVFRKAGFNARAFAQLQKQHSAELERIHAVHKADAIKRAARAKSTLHSSIGSQSQALERLAANKPFFPFPLVTLDKPFLIWATPRSNIISDSSIEPFNSWAKIRIDRSSSGAEKLSFYFMWDNPSDFFALINASTFMSATGHLKATAFGGVSGIDPTSRFSDIGVSANLALWSWWLKPPQTTPYTSMFLGGVSESASFWDKSESRSISDGANLDKTQFIVPPHEVVIIEVTFQVGLLQRSRPGRRRFRERRFQGGLSARRRGAVDVAAQRGDGSRLGSADRSTGRKSALN